MSHLFDFLGRDASRIVSAVLLIALEIGGLMAVIRVLQYHLGASRAGRIFGIGLSIVLGLIWSRYYALTYSALVSPHPEHLVTIVIVGSLANAAIANLIFKPDE